MLVTTSKGMLGAELRIRWLCCSTAELPDTCAAPKCASHRRVRPLTTPLSVRIPRFALRPSSHTSRCVSTPEVRDDVHAVIFGVVVVPVRQRNAR